MTDFYQKLGTARTWKASGGDAALTLTGLASGSARQGQSLDLGATFAREYGYRLKTAFGSSPTGGTLLRLFLGFSADNSNWPGGLSGSDAAYSDADDLRNLAELAPLVADADTAAQCVVGRFCPAGRYAAPVVYNDATGQALSGTAGDHVLEIWPLIDTSV